MAAVHSTMLPLGTEAPRFSLPDPSGRTWSLDDFAEAPVLVVAFLCNHCPYVKHVRHRLAEVAGELQARGAAFVAVNSNDVDAYPEDAPEEMARESAQIGYPFPYLFDETQDVAKAYRAACTPDFYVFDGERRLAYRGQFDASRPGSDVPVTGADLHHAVDAALEGRAPTGDQRPSLGCSIKWRPGNEPDGT
ncbi:MAG TPA: thioredoxin family protein [Acidimicrobiia bacterium]|nr:thioredoxin family protein [Acidimicrobiia bacterium]